jgi:hypothetical protein
MQKLGGLRMQTITARLLEYGTDEFLQTTQLPAVPREGEFFILSDKITPDWAKQFYRVRAVTYFINCEYVIIHVEKYDQEKERQKWDKMINDIKSIKARTDEIKKDIKM